MKVYTVQRKNFLENIDNDGFIIPPEPVYDDKEWDEHIRPAYQWMNDQYSKRTNLPLDRNLIWVFNTPIGFEWAKDAYNAEDLIKTVFEVPMREYKANFLWSDYQSWHSILNYQPGWESFTKIFDFNIKKHDKLIIPQGVTTRLNISWLKSVSPVINDEQTHKF